MPPYRGGAVPRALLVVIERVAPCQHRVEVVHNVKQRAAHRVVQSVLGAVVKPVGFEPLRQHRVVAAPQPVIRGGGCLGLADAPGAPRDQGFADLKPVIKQPPLGLLDAMPRGATARHDIGVGFNLIR
jgi:hypothetical protein